MIKTLALAAILATQPAPPPAAARCITRQQVGDLAVVGSAIFVEGARNACRPHLAPTAFLAQPASAEYSARLRQEARGRFASAADGIARASGEADATGPIAMMRTMMSTMLAEGIGGEFTAMVDVPICRDVNDMIEIMSALAPDQLARFSSAAMSLGSQFAARMTLPAPPAPPPAPAGRARRGSAANAAPPPPPRPRPPVLCPE
ncbi:MAG TPA: hypothetical protein VGO55_12125 [Allosphingosinicella sp.]|jgi:hypothetical protein|nr:hypothetical protein [Allosphingosinicella sp.]